MSERRGRAGRATDQRGQILQILADELLTPVTVVQGVAQTLAAHVGLTADQAGMLAASAERAGARLRRLVSSLTAVAALEDGTLAVAPRPIPADMLVKGLAAQFPDEERLVLAASPARRLVVLADLALATRALSAVVENALRFSPRDDPVDVRVSKRRDLVEVQVVDRGPGVPSPQRSEIFDLFVQGDSGDSRPHRGLGIGLYLARKVMDAHAGRVDVRDGPEGGTVFVLSFPLA